MAVCAPTCGCAIQTETLALSGSGSAADPWVINSANDPAIAQLQADIDVINAKLNNDYIPYSDFNAKGDLLVGTANGEGSRLAPGPFGRVLTTDSAAASGVKWGGGVVEIETITSPSGNVNFSNIPQTFRHLWLEISGRHDDASSANTYRGISARYNGDNGTSYQAFVDYADQTGSLTVGPVNASLTGSLLGYIGDVHGTLSARISNYTGATPKVADSWGTAAIGGLWGNGARRFRSSSSWANTAAVSSLTIVGFAGDNWASGTTLALYGIG